MLFKSAYKILMCKNPFDKKIRIEALERAWHLGLVDKLATPIHTVEVPGRPIQPNLVPPREVKSRKLSSLEGRAALIHALAHIEFNAINLALDAIYRFQSMPDQYYSDWLKVAREEAYHFNLLALYLKKISYQYGDFPAHNGLWEMAITTAYDPLVRMALVPRLMEARGLDVAPLIISKLQQVGDDEAIAILKIIEKDEIEHVKIGNYWFNYLCNERKICPISQFKALLNQYGRRQVKPPFAYDSRFKAGFTESEMAVLEAVAQLNL